MTRPLVIVMVTSSFPRFAGDSVGTFMEPIARSVAARGHEVHVVAPWHPLVRRPSRDGGIHFHFYRYAPVASLNVFGYAAAMRADVRLRAAAYVAAPLALTAGWWAARRIARRHRATIMHGHWVIPGGVTAAAAAPRLPLVISLHGSDVYVAERLKPAGIAAGAALRRAGFVTACSADLANRGIALGADPQRTRVVPYGVDTDSFHPDPTAREQYRADLAVAPEGFLVATAGRLVSKKGFEYLIDAIAQVPSVVLAIAGEGSLRAALQARVEALGIQSRVHLLGDRSQAEVARLFSAADVIVTPSIRDDAGNVDGLPNVVMEALASGTPLVTTAAGGIGAVVEAGVTALVVAERDAAGIANAIVRLTREPELRRGLGEAGRRLVQRQFGWDATAEQFEFAYRHALALHSARR
ncbi:MAG TPA: glycosyltransferase family 4 protein [Vicinamibacterales bacterium]